MAVERWLIVGCGYVGSQVAVLAQQRGHIVHALTRSESRSGELRALGVSPCVGHWLDRDSLRHLPQVDRVLVAVPHRADERTADRGNVIDRTADTSAAAAQSTEAAEQTHAIGLRNLCAALPDGWRSLLYLSTTGVYGESSSEWIDENAPTSPHRIGPRIAVAAEQWLQHASLQHNWPAERAYCILRLAGIYGPGRIPLAERLQRGEPLAVPRQGHLNLVHVSDIAQMVCWLLTHSMQHETYLFSDGQPVLRETFYRHLAQLCGVAEPEFIQPDPQAAKTMRASDKRISPARLLEETGYQLQYPDYRSGLASALDNK